MRRDFGIPRGKKVNIRALARARIHDTYAPIVTLRVPLSRNHLRIDAKERAARDREKAETTYTGERKCRSSINIVPYMPLYSNMYVYTYNAHYPCTTRKTPSQCVAQGTLTKS